MNAVCARLSTPTRPCVQCGLEPAACSLQSTASVRCAAPKLSTREGNDLRSDLLPRVDMLEVNSRGQWPEGAPGPATGPSLSRRSVSLLSSLRCAWLRRDVPLAGGWGRGLGCEREGAASCRRCRRVGQIKFRREMIRLQRPVPDAACWVAGCSGMLQASKPGRLFSRSTRYQRSSCSVSDQSGEGGSNIFFATLSVGTRTPGYSPCFLALSIASPPPHRTMTRLRRRSGIPRIQKTGTRRRHGGAVVVVGRGCG
ncbi:hypothetical protein CC85DRAFT_53639 [Cutaneotrichosporon oleaginosum]|uniref:Uncharacterized protein n=1 Tax=Cutaneotrichosporon oleaginosum TaxID=879819 RepID=A0A0J0XYF5_9TREE|nr:uncharacterized protein CC85DRAFT_53639 [Cutaneotrichosporon oleaginosum]KLT46087.1 hypothetical protein CC85DRAFT_53639 [Cutaneotrichosporon oleaginosum]TXT10100.1 hypothetical protein COLE_04034 [Cutaneotrichosporon oleaginosum]